MSLLLWQHVKLGGRPRARRFARRSELSSGQFAREKGYERPNPFRPTR